VYGQPVAQANNHSKVAWWHPKHDATVEFSTYSLLENHNGWLGTVKVNNTLGADYKIPQFGIEIANLWETVPHVYLLVCNTNRPSSENEATPNNNYILDARKEIIREAKFSFPDKWNKQLMEYFNLGEVSAFHTFSYEKGEAIPSPVYYVNNEREEVIAVEEWRANNRTNFCIPGFDSSTIIEAEHGNGDVE
jgi:hypothetical protein